MERYWQIEKVNLKHNVPVHVLVCSIMLGVSPLLMGVSNIGEQDTAKVLELYVALIGIIMITPVFLPEQQKEIRDLVCAKYMKSAVVYLVRILGNLFILAVFLGIYVWMLHHNNCTFPETEFFLGTYTEMLFLGGLGLFFYGFSDNLVVGYMIPVIYYVMAMGSGNKYLKLFYPFSMMTGSYKEKIVLFLGAVILITAGIFLRCRRR